MSAAAGCLSTPDRHLPHAPGTEDGAHDRHVFIMKMTAARRTSGLSDGLPLRAAECPYLAFQRGLTECENVACKAAILERRTRYCNRANLATLRVGHHERLVRARIKADIPITVRQRPQ